ncbi:MAG TPA: hypothetical protein VIH57_12240 [Bacteroidales bacterium]
MKKKSFFLLLLSITLSCLNCTKDNGSKGLITISGITERDDSANNAGNIDTTDWKFNDKWSLTEENLFKINNSNTVATETAKPNATVVTAGYPNPAKTMICLAFQLESNMYYDLRIVDNNLNIKVQFDSVTYSFITINDSQFAGNELYRAYYKIYSGNKVYRGHGDFKFIK